MKTLQQFGSTVGIVPVTFDKGDRIVAVNRRNKRLNIEIDFMNEVKVVGLTYEEVQRQGGSI